MCHVEHCAVVHSMDILVCVCNVVKDPLQSYFIVDASAFRCILLEINKTLVVQNIKSLCYRPIGINKCILKNKTI